MCSSTLAVMRGRHFAKQTDKIIYTFLTSELQIDNASSLDSWQLLPMLLRIASNLNRSRIRRMFVGDRSARPAQKLQSKSRKTSSTKQQSRLIIGLLTIDRQRHLVQLGSRSIHLTPKEFALLCSLAACPGKVYRREELLQRVWGDGTYVEVRTVDAHMSKLRHKLRTSEDALSFAETVWGIGYRLRDPS